MVRIQRLQQVHRIGGRPDMKLELVLVALLLTSSGCIRSEKTLAQYCTSCPSWSDWLSSAGSCGEAECETVTRCEDRTVGSRRDGRTMVASYFDPESAELISVVVCKDLVAPASGRPGFSDCQWYGPPTRCDNPQSTSVVLRGGTLRSVDDEAPAE